MYVNLFVLNLLQITRKYSVTNLGSANENHDVVYEALPRVLGNMGKGYSFQGEQGNKGQILRGIGEQRQYWGTGNIRKQIFDFWGTG